MKICYVANSRFPSERAHMTQIVQMCNAFADNGHEVTLIVTDRKTDITESSESFFGVPLKFSVVRISVPDIAGLSPKIPEVLRPYVFLIQRLVFAYRTILYIQKHPCAYIYGRDEGILLFFSKILRVPVVWESHEAKFSFVVKRLLRVVHRAIVISEGIKDFYVSRGVAERTLLVAHDAVDRRFFEPHVSQEEARKQLGIVATKPVAMYIGGLDAWKGTETLFECAHNQDIFELVIVGGKEQEVATLRQKYPTITFLGPRPYRELPLCQQAGDVLVIPNTAKNKLSAEYTSPLKLFSYMTSKKPIVASRIPSITNVLRDDEAYFFTADSKDELQRAIIRATQDESRGERAERAYKKSLSYTWRSRAEKILNFL